MGGAQSRLVFTWTLLENSPASFLHWLSSQEQNTRPSKLGPRAANLALSNSLHPGKDPGAAGLQGCGPWDSDFGQGTQSRSLCSPLAVKEGRAEGMS